MSWLGWIKQTFLGRPPTPTDAGEEPGVDPRVGWDRIERGDLDGAVAAFSAVLRRGESADAFYRLEPEHTVRVLGLG